MAINVGIENIGFNAGVLSSKKMLKILRKAHEEIRGLDCSKGTGWVELPNFIEKAEFINLKQCAKEVQDNSDILLVIGIGGSYLGAAAAISMLKQQPKIEIKFVGTSLDPNELLNIIEYCKDKNVTLNVISKSGETMETAATFEILENFMKKKYKKQKEYKNRIFVTTDYEKGDLRKIATEEGYRSFVIPRNIGGRYSVLTPVGLFPMAVAGINIDKVIQGAKFGYQECYKLDVNENPAYKYSLCRYILYKKGKKIESLCTFDPRLKTFADWYKQLFAESEGKNGKGLFVTNFMYSTDLHSLGQFVQEGSPLLFETFLDVKQAENDIKIDNISEDRKSKYLNGHTFAELNRIVYESTLQSHCEAKVPEIIIEVEKIDEEILGELLYFYEMSCAISAYLLGVNPFNQPGVEVYKRIVKEKLKK